MRLAMSLNKIISAEIEELAKKVKSTSDDAETARLQKEMEESRQMDAGVSAG